MSLQCAKGKDVSKKKKIFFEGSQNKIYKCNIK